MENYVGEIRMFAGNYAPVGWVLCDGSLLPISTYEVLYTLIGTTYGGDGTNTFSVPDLRGRVPVHRGSGPGLTPIVQGQASGTENVSLTAANLPPHNHPLNAVSVAATTGAPVNNMIATTSINVYVENTGAPLPPVTMGGGSITPTGTGLPVSIIQPFTAVTFIIATTGIYPSQS